jgi:5-(carboxyamino)imidazole ribonucleotide mutase
MWAVTSSPSSTPVPPPRVGVVMGSRSDFPTLEGALEVLARLEIAYEVRVLSAHRTPELLASYAARAERLNFSCIIAAAGGAAHLPGMLAAFTWVPVLGVPVQSRALSGQDSLLSIVQMPGGVPVATFAIGPAGAKNAALFAAGLLSTTDAGVRGRLQAFREQQTRAVLDDPFFEGHPQAGAE